MEEVDIQNQISEINTKLDLVLSNIDQQRLKSEVVTDLVKDVTMVGNDMFRSLVSELEEKNVSLDTEQISMLLLRLIKNVGNINQTFGMLESMSDLMKDLGPIINSMGIEVITKIAEFEDKGYFRVLENLGNNSDRIFNAIDHLTQPDMLVAIEKITKVMSTIKIDDQLDDKSLFKIFKEMKSPEVRKTLSWTLRLVKEVNS